MGSTYPGQRPQCPSVSPHFLLIYVTRLSVYLSVYRLSVCFCLWSLSVCVCLSVCMSVSICLPVCLSSLQYDVFLLQQTFAYDSHYWSNNSTYNPDAANRGLDKSETKTSAYWTTSFSKLCLGMKSNNTLTWMSLNHYTITSLFSLLADGMYRPTLLGRRAWLSLVPGSALQPYCNGEGFNINFASVRVRIGILGSSTKGCTSPGSFLGFGGGGSDCITGQSHVSCGNVYSCDGTNGPKSIDTFGYILIQ